MTTERKPLRAGYPKSMRLLCQEDFSSLRDKPLYWHERNLSFYFKKTEKSHARLGLSVSRRIGNAVCRNQLKRTLRESFRRSDLRGMPVDLLVVVRKRARERGCPCREVSLSWRSGIGKIVGILENGGVSA